MRTILGRYRLTAVIASGGMGTLWEGADLRLNRKIVVKLIRQQSASARPDDGAIRRFSREAQVTARLGHPGVPVIYDFGDEDGEFFMVMERVAGMTVADLIAEVEPVPVAWAAAITAQACAVLAAAHAQGLIHRDLKPSNIMIGPDGSVKVLDFGIAAALSAGEFSTITRTGEIPGTACYMAPEVADGKPAEPASDLYSVGCVLYELLTGKRVFADPDPMAEVAAHLTQLPGPVSDLRPDAPGGLVTLTTNLLAKTPAARPPDACTVATELLSFVRNLPPLPGVVSVLDGPSPAQLYAQLQARIAARVR